MKQFILRNNLYLLTALAIGVAIYVAVNWAAIPFLQRMVGLFFVAIMLHVWEESRFPGGFAEMITARLNFAITDPRVAELILAGAILYLGFVPLFFPHVAWLAMAAMLLGVLEPIAHLAAIKMFQRKHFYSPGLLTAVVLLLPISIYGIAFAVRNDLMRPWDWIWSLLYMATGLAIAQGTVVRMSGLRYTEFLKRVRSTLFAKQV
ncbi:HXXEE domain-containing protein [Pedosphaera parvula]|uniref:HXXEE domain-containing protein n=1 Tax=Pedosphaera parvula (strain Ellin514) TaxID=320771 RepID=B9XKA2_PEDPL|nr:HXXEE domain-containing protein [Pedosphaera parvula]EEF59740.1 conserved hypothetical protein [Pedosphaera parvula Ellin514]